MDDLISRKDTISAIMGEHPEAHYPDWYARIIEELPSARPKSDRNTGDLIERQAVLDLARNLTFKNIEGLKHYRYRCIDPDAVRALPAITPPLTWVPITKQAPKENGYYLTSTINREVYCDYWSYDHFDRTEAVVAWMKLPEPYKEEMTH